VPEGRRAARRLTMAKSRFLSIPYLLLRISTAGGGLLAGLIQTFVFARILSPERFSVFILVGMLGVTLWLFDLGMAKILFVRLRSWFLGDRAADADITRHTTAVIVLYFLLCLAGTIACYVAAITHFGSSAKECLELALFFLFTALTLVWFVLRNISVAVDDFIFFESLEAARRLAHIGTMLATLIGLPLMAFVVIANVVWAILFAWMLTRLARKGALAPTLAGFGPGLKSFFRENRKQVFQTGTYAANEFYIYSFPYLVVPYAFGLGAPTIILDTAFKVFRGATVIYSAGCDVAVPRQTRAFNERDRKSLILATLMAAGLTSLPCAIFSLLMIFGAGPFFSLLLGHSATMPSAVTYLLVVLLVANQVQTVSNFLLVHTGFFRQIANLSVVVSLMMTAGTILALALRLDLTGFLQVYTAVYVGSALLYLWLAIRGPLAARK
jgi:O-antigen/teichoic acid export membrane protein